MIRNDDKKLSPKVSTELGMFVYWVLLGFFFQIVWLSFNLIFDKLKDVYL